MTTSQGLGLSHPHGKPGLHGEPALQPGTKGLSLLSPAQAGCRGLCLPHPADETRVCSHTLACEAQSLCSQWAVGPGPSVVPPLVERCVSGPWKLVPHPSPCMAWGGAVLVGSTYNVNFLFLPHYQSTGMWMNFVLGGGEE